MTPTEYIGNVMQIAYDHRGNYVRQEHLSPTRVQLVYDIPLAELIYDFFDKLKSSTRGYGTLNYEITGYMPGDLVKLRILVNGKEVDALTSIVHTDQAEYRGRAILKKMRKEIPRHLFEVVLQAATTAGSSRARRSRRYARTSPRSATRRHHAEAQAPREAKEGSDGCRSATSTSAEGLPRRSRRRRGGSKPARRKVRFRRLVLSSLRRRRGGRRESGRGSPTGCEVARSTRRSRAAIRHLYDALRSSIGGARGRRNEAGAREPAALASSGSSRARRCGSPRTSVLPRAEAETYDVRMLGGSSAGAVADAIARTRASARSTSASTTSRSRDTRSRRCRCCSRGSSRRPSPRRGRPDRRQDECCSPRRTRPPGRTRATLGRRVGRQPEACGRTGRWSSACETRGARPPRAFGGGLDSGLWRSCLLQHLAELRLSALDDERLEARKRLEEYVRTRPEDVELRGPAFESGSPAVETAIVSTWESASRSLATMCAARGIRFVLVLAPAEPGTPDVAASLRTAGEMVTGPTSRFLDLAELDSARIVPAIAKALFADTER
jgi:hypothetical protein